MSTNYYDAENNKLIPIAGKGDFPADFGTKAEFEAKKDDLPVGTVFTTTDEFEEGEKDIYSTEEVKTNKMWFDGKPIYRLSGISTTSTITNKINKTIIDNMIRSDVHVYTPDFIYGAMSYVQTSSNRSCYEIYNDGIRLLSGVSFNKIVFTFEYTKTN